MTTHIVTAGGGGFSMSPTGAPTALDLYIVELSGQQAPQVCFVPTAAADDPTYTNRFLTAFGALGVRTMVLTLWQDAARSVQRLQQADVIYVGGGSTVNMLALWHAHGVGNALKQLTKSGKNIVLAGLSAGAACWYQGCITDSFGPMRAWRGGLGLLSGSFCPHFDGEAERAPVFTEAIASGVLEGGWAADDGAALHWVDGQLAHVIAEEEGKHVYQVMPSNEPSTSGVTSVPLDVELL